MYQNGTAELTVFCGVMGTNYEEPEAFEPEASTRFS
jgi:hypothetical protein